MKIAVIHVPHTQCEVSLKYMLESVGYRVLRPPREVVPMLDKITRQTVPPVLPQASLSQFRNCSLFATIKWFHIESLLKAMPYLKKRILWFDINGGNPGEPKTGPNAYKAFPFEVPVPYLGSCKCYLREDTSGPRYVCYIPLVSPERYARPRATKLHPPICLVHSVKTWGHGPLSEIINSGGEIVRMYGGHTKRGPIPPQHVPKYLNSALCYVHIKARDNPGFSLYETLASGCPAIITSHFLERTQYHELYEDGVTCLVAEDNKDPDGKARNEYLKATVLECIERLKSPTLNAQIGRAGQKRLAEVLWTKERDGASLHKFLTENGF